jgi:hypothetical protein
VDRRPEPTEPLRGVHADGPSPEMLIDFDLAVENADLGDLGDLTSGPWA